MLSEQARQAGQTSGSRITADRRIDHRFIVPTLLQALAQELDPALFDFQTESGADTIANDHYALCPPACRYSSEQCEQQAVSKRLHKAVPMSESVIVASHLSKVVRSSEAELTILDDVSLSIERGASIAIVGASGSGKSTLLSLLAGLDLPTRGQVRLAGQALSALNEHQRAALRAEHVGFVFQSFQLLSSLTALENVMLPLELHGRSDARERASTLLQRVGLAERTSHYPRQLSGGEQQRVAIARAFASEPKILFADEPTGNLDAATGQRITDLLFQLNREQATTLVMVTHDDRLAERCQAALRIDAGRLVQPV